MSKYDPLCKWLSVNQSSTISASFQQIESILGFNLPESARTHEPWWANEAGDSRHVQCRAWLDAGFQTVNLNLLKETVDFVKV